MDASAARSLRGQLEGAGFVFKDPPPEHTTFAGSGPGVSVTHYGSGKLLVQGKGAADFAAAYLDDIDQLVAQAGVDACDRVDEPIIGTDESGKGDYFGPLVIAAMLVHPQDVPILRMQNVRDSKTVGDREAMEIAEMLEEAYPTRIAVVSISPHRYNEMHGEFRGNLNLLLAWGHAQVVANILAGESCGRVLSDRFGNERLIRDALAKKDIDVKLEQRVRAESHPAVAAASILARARFLRELRRLGDDIGTKLPKGAGAPVDVVARELWRKGGREILSRVAKLHFKTTQKAMEP